MARPKHEDYISLAEAATMLDVHIDTARTQVLADKLRAEKLAGRWVTKPRWVLEYRRDHKRRGPHPAQPREQQAQPAEQVPVEEESTNG